MSFDHSSFQISRRQALAGVAAATLSAPVACPVAAANSRRPELIDVHHHIFPPFYLEGKAGEVAARSRGYTQVLEWTPETSIKEMDAAGTTTAILSMSAPVWFGDVGEARALATRSNEYALELTLRFPGRFSFFSVLPMPNVPGSLEEIAQTKDSAGFALLSNYEGRYLGDPQFAPVLEELNRRAEVVYVHPTVASCCQNLVPDLAPAFLELPFDSSRTIASLLYSGSLSRYRNIRWIFSHGGGTIPFIGDRLSQWALARPDLAKRLPEGPMAELKRLNFDTASVTNAPALAALGSFVSWSQVLFGTDYPYVKTASQLAELRASNVKAADIKMIEAGNARRIILDTARGSQA
jgi:6-methylsalicylate decarboxylase